MSSLNKPSCAACKFLRRKCTPGCVFAPHFPPEQTQKFVNVHRSFGASNVAKLLNQLDPAHREEAVASLVYEAEARLHDPVYGCVFHIHLLQQRLEQIKYNLYTAKNELSTLQAPHHSPFDAAGTSSHQQQDGTNVGLELTSTTNQRILSPEQQRQIETQQLEFLRNVGMQDQQQGFGNSSGFVDGAVFNNNSIPGVQRNVVSKEYEFLRNVGMQDQQQNEVIAGFGNSSGFVDGMVFNNNTTSGMQRNVVSKEYEFLRNIGMQDQQQNESNARFRNNSGFVDWRDFNNNSMSGMQGVVAAAEQEFLGNIGTQYQQQNTGFVDGRVFNNDSMSEMQGAVAVGPEQEFSRNVGMQDQQQNESNTRSGNNSGFVDWMDIREQEFLRNVGIQDHQQNEINASFGNNSGFVVADTTSVGTLPPSGLTLVPSQQFDSTSFYVQQQQQQQAQQQEIQAPQEYLDHQVQQQQQQRDGSDGRRSGSIWPTY